MIDGKNILNRVVVNNNSRVMYENIPTNEGNLSFEYGFMSFFSKKRMFNLLHNNNSISAVAGLIFALICHYVGLLLIVIPLLLKEIVYIVHNFILYSLKGYIHSRDVFDVLFTAEDAFFVLLIVFLIFAPLINMYRYYVVHNESN